MSKDPRLFHEGTNIYVYAQNDPVNFIDLTGHDRLPDSAIVFLAQYFPGLNLNAIQVYPDSGRVPDSLTSLTDGNHIYFGVGWYDPYSVDGLGIIAHELTHASQFADYDHGAAFLNDIFMLANRDQFYRKWAAQFRLYGESKDNYFEWAAQNVEDIVTRDLSEGLVCR